MSIPINESIPKDNEVIWEGRMCLKWNDCPSYPYKLQSNEIKTKEKMNMSTTNNENIESNVKPFDSSEWKENLERNLKKILNQEEHTKTLLDKAISQSRISDMKRDIDNWYIPLRDRAQLIEWAIKTIFSKRNSILNGYSLIGLAGSLKIEVPLLLYILKEILDTTTDEKVKKFIQEL